MPSSDTYFKKGNKLGRKLKRGHKLSAGIKRPDMSSINKKRKGRKLSKAIKRKLSLAKRGRNNAAYIDGRSSLVTRIRRNFKYRQWRSDVFTRDNFICQDCGYDKGNILQAHHIKSFTLIIRQHNIKTIKEAEKCEELWNINNGVTLCVKCHYKYK